MSNLTRILAPIAVIGGLAGSADAADYVRVNKFLGWETTTVTRTLPVVVPQKVVYRDACGNSCVGINYTPAEMVVGQCKTVHWNAKDSIPGRACGLLDDIGKGLDRAFSPRPATARPCLPYDRCSQMYIAPVAPRGCDAYPVFGPNSRLEPIPAMPAR